MTRDDRVDAYIEDRTAPFAQPILRQIRDAMHDADDEIDEDIKWGAPAFLHKGRTLALMASFKAHAVLNFTRDKELDFGKAGLSAKPGEAMGLLGKLKSADDLPAPNQIADLVEQAIALEEAGPPKKAKKAIKVPPIPKPFADALAANPEAKKIFDGFPPGARRDYVEWVAGAKREATRDKRIATAVEWLAEGKKRNWKYENC